MYEKKSLDKISVFKYNFQMSCFYQNVCPLFFPVVPPYISLLSLSIIVHYFCPLLKIHRTNFNQTCNWHKSSFGKLIKILFKWRWHSSPRGDCKEIVNCFDIFRTLRNQWMHVLKSNLAESFICWPGHISFYIYIREYSFPNN